MQEEIEHKTVNLAISTTKLSARTLLRGMQFLLRQYDSFHLYFLRFSFFCSLFFKRIAVAPSIEFSFDENKRNVFMKSINIFY